MLDNSSETCLNSCKLVGLIHVIFVIISSQTSQLLNYMSACKAKIIINLFNAPFFNIGLGTLKNMHCCGTYDSPNVR